MNNDLIKGKVVKISNRVAYKKFRLDTIIYSIKGNVEKIKSLNSLIKEEKSGSFRRHILTGKRDEVSEFVRIHLLAYGLVTGKKRNEIEKSGPNKTLRYLQKYDYEYTAKKFANKIHSIFVLHEIFPFYRPSKDDISEWLLNGDISLAKKIRRLK